MTVHSDNPIDTILTDGQVSTPSKVRKKPQRDDTASDVRQLRLLSQSVRLEEAGVPKVLIWTTVLVFMTVGIFVAWASVANINELARAPGEIVPANYEQVVQHLEGGIIKEIHVREGDIVEAGEPIARLQAADVDASLERTSRLIVSQLLQIERLEAFVEQRDPDFSALKGVRADEVSEQTELFRSMVDAQGKERQILDRQLAQQKQLRASLQNQKDSLWKNLSLLNDVYSRRSRLQKDGFLSDLKLMETELRLNTVKGEYAVVLKNIKQAEESIAEFESRIGSLVASRKDEALAKLERLRNELNQNRELRSSVVDRSTRLVVRSPVRGIIKSVDVTTIGGVVPPGGSIASIIPHGNVLMAEVRVPPQYVGRIAVGQPVLVNVSAFDFARFGTLDGKLEHVSAMTFRDDRGGRYYKGRIYLQRQHFGGEPSSNRILPGMTVTANIVTGEKTLLEYLLKPIHVALESSLTEY